MQGMTGSSFHTEIGDRIRTARGSLADARAGGDHYLEDIHLGTLEELERLAAAHGLDVARADGDLDALGHEVREHDPAGLAGTPREG